MNAPKMTLYRSAGCGSTVVEAVLELVHVPYETVSLDWENKADWEPLQAVNPLGQVPTLVTADGGVLTESAAIVLWLSELHPQGGLLPARGSKAHAAVYRWVSYLATNVYAQIIIGDFPERYLGGRPGAQCKRQLAAGAKARAQFCWESMERALPPTDDGGYLLGAQMTVLDLYAAMVSRWRPGRRWLKDQCPRIHRAVELTEQHPVVREVWRRNFE